MKFENVWKNTWHLVSQAQFYKDFFVEILSCGKAWLKYFNSQSERLKNNVA